MVSLNSNLREGLYLDPAGMALPNISLFSTTTTGNATSLTEDMNKKVRKPYTITKSRESWTELEHDKFLEALQLFDRDWKKIEAFIRSKSIIQIRSHAQKYFLKVQKSGTNEHLPPPRPKRKAAHPYPQKASKTSPDLTKVRPPLQASPAIPDAGFVRVPNSSTSLRHDSAASVPGWTEKPLHNTSFSHLTGGDAKSAWHSVPYTYACGESTSRTRPTVLPDFTQVYSFVGSVFDPTVTGHLDKLKKLDPIDVETVLLLMRNMSINLASRDFEDHRRILSSYEINPEEGDALDLADSILGSQSEDAG